MKTIKAALLLSLSLNLLLGWIIWRGNKQPSIVVKTVADPAVDKVLQAYLENASGLQTPAIGRNISPTLLQQATGNPYPGSFFQDLKDDPSWKTPNPPPFKARRRGREDFDEPIQIKERHLDEEFHIEPPKVDRGLYITPGAAGI